MSDTQSYIQQHKQRFLDELIELLKIASISADPAYNQDVLNCADAVAKHLANAGADQVEICETKGYPVVYGEKIINPELPTVLVYGHYDVQPADPLELWESGPFEPVVKKTELHPEGAIFARGSADDKGQFFMHVKAFEAMMRTNSLPCNIKFIIEGEEEVGSVSLAGFLEENKETVSHLELSNSLDNLDKELDILTNRVEKLNLDRPFFLRPKVILKSNELIRNIRINVTIAQKIRKVKTFCKL